MREAELLREALVNATMSLETISRNAGKSEALLDDFMSVRGYANSRATIAREALAAKHDVCVWTHHPNYTYTRSCDGRKTQFIPGSYMNGADFETDTICSGCGRKIEVKGE